jgi:hypothetical protein
MQKSFFETNVFPAEVADEFLSVHDIAAWLKVTPRTLWHHIGRGAIPSYGTRGATRLRRSEVAVAMRDIANARTERLAERRAARRADRGPGTA